MARTDVNGDSVYITAIKSRVLLHIIISANRFEQSVPPCDGSYVISFIDEK